MTTSIKLDNKMENRIRHLAGLRQQSTHWIMCEAIAQYIKREEKREAFRQDTLEAWDEYQATGLHATAEEVNAWLAGWGTENELPAPVCHK